MRHSGDTTELTYLADGTLDRSSAVTEYAPMVKRIARYMLSKLPASVQLDDLVQAGMIGLMEAYSRFEESQGIQFEAYATQRVRGAMLDELRQNDWLPRATRKALRDIEAAMHRVQQRLQRPPNEREIAAEMGIPLGEYQLLLQNSKGYQLLHYDELGEGEDPFLDHNLPDSRENPLDRLEDKRFRASVIAAIEGLPERDRLLMGLYYEQELNFREIAEVIGVTESRVCQIHTQAIARIRSQLRNW